MWSGMVVLIDTNIIIDFLMTREPFYKTYQKSLKIAHLGN